MDKLPLIVGFDCIKASLLTRVALGGGGGELEHLQDLVASPSFRLFTAIPLAQIMILIKLFLPSISKFSIEVADL